jgi:hypothetical protein
MEQRLCGGVATGLRFRVEIGAPHGGALMHESTKVEPLKMEIIFSQSENVTRTITRYGPKFDPEETLARMEGT